MNGQPTPVMTTAVTQARALGFVSELPQRWPRQGVAAALVVERNGAEHVRPVIVVDFYREADLP